MTPPAHPPIDTHAHVDVGVDADALEALGAVVFAVTRSLDEFEQTRRRADRITVWGLGCHPGVVRALRDYDGERFSSLADETPLISEVGLDGRGPEPDLQRSVFADILERLRAKPRIISIHSARAAGPVLEMIEEFRPPGAVLHWWTGTKAQTSRAIDLGCWFSINPMLKPELLRLLPSERVLTETDHPAGNRVATLRQPGAVHEVEARLASHWGLNNTRARARLWSTTSQLVDLTRTARMFPSVVQRMLDHAES